MFERFSKSVSKAAAVVSGKEILSEQGKAKLRSLSEQLQERIASLKDSDIESSISFSSKDKGKDPEMLVNPETKQALNILLKVKALLDKLVTLNSWQLMALGSLEPAQVDPAKAIDDLNLEELVQDLLLNRDIYWDIKNKLLHPSLLELTTTLKGLILTDFSDAGTAVLYTIGGVDKIHAVGIILSSLFPFYSITDSRAGISDSQYHPDVGAKLLPNFRQGLYSLQDAFLLELKNGRTSDEKIEILSRYKTQYHEKVRAFLAIVHELPGETIFLETRNTTFKQDSIISFRPQGGILRGLMQIEASLNAELAHECKGILTEPLLTTVYDDVANGLEQEAIRQPREDLFAMVTTHIIKKFGDYIAENTQETGLTKAKADLLQRFLYEFIYGNPPKDQPLKTSNGKEVFVNKDGQWRTADNFERGQFYTCAEVATKLLVELIAFLKEHDQMCRQANRGVGRTGLLLASAIQETTAYLTKPYDRQVDDVFLSALATYKEQMSKSFAPEEKPEAQSSAISLNM